MEVTGRLDEHGRAWLPITVRGNRGEATIEAVIDLGFTETMALPIEIVAPWRYRDRVVNWMDYEAMIVMISGMARF